MYKKVLKEGLLISISAWLLFGVTENISAQGTAPSTNKTVTGGLSEDTLGSPKPLKDDSKAMALPFKEIKKGLEKAKEGKLQRKTSLNENNVPYIADVELPTLDEQKVVEKRLENRLHKILIKRLEARFISVTVSSRYLLNTFPITEGTKQITKVKLPGFPNHVWMPLDAQSVIGLVNQVQQYNTVIVIVNTPMTRFAIEALRQELDEPIQELELQTRDVLRVIYTRTAKPLSEEARPQKKLEEEIAEAEKPMDEVKEESPDEEVKPLLAEDDFEIEELGGKEHRVTQEIEIKATKLLLEARKAYFADKIDQALDHIQKALSLNPRSAQGYAMLGSIYYRLQWNSLAAKQWKRSLKLDPNNQEVIQYLERLE